METAELTVMEEELLTGKLEAILFAAGEPVAYRDLMRVTECDLQTLQNALDGLSQTCQEKGRGIQLILMEKTCQLSTKPVFYPQIRDLLGLHQSSPLSRAAMETLSIIAYRQPATRVDVEMIRGVSSSSSIQSLLDKGLITEAGRKDAPGRPFLYKTTEKFLRSVHLSALSELPSYELFSPDSDNSEETIFEISE